ncbi:MAG: FeoA family protein, partial [Acidimicrobiales bacterium]
ADPQVSLADIEPGETVRVERITEEIELDMASLEFLDEHGLIPGRSARVTGRAPDGTLTLDVGGSVVALAPAICQQMFVAAV